MSERTASMIANHGEHGERAVNRRSIIAWSLFAIICAAIVGSLTVSLVLGTWDPADSGLAIPAAVGTFAMSLIGALVAARAGNAIGWIFLAIPVTFWVSQLAQDLHDAGVGGPETLRLSYWFSQWPFFASMALLVSVFFLFPTGQVSSSRWRWVMRIYVVALAVTIVGFALQPYEIRAHGVAITNPVGIGSLQGFLDRLLAVAGFTLVVCAFLSFASLVARYRGADPEERQQLRWLFAVGAFGLAGLVLLFVFGPLSEADPEIGLYQSISDALIAYLVTVLTVGIPVAAGVAIFRYHLYDLNLVVRKTVVFAILAAFITVVYVGVVVGIGSLATGSLLPSIVATATVAALFQPVRGWATRLANRLVFGRRAEPYEVLSSFSGRVGGTYAEDDVLPRLARVIADGTGAQRTEVWLHRGGEPDLAAAWPANGEPLGDADRTVPIVHRGETLGEIRVRKPATEPFTATEDKLLGDLASQAGVILRNVNMTAELRTRVDELSARAEELRASRARIVAAHDAERRRLERNIHDGAQQHLVALAVKLRLAQAIVGRDPERAAAMMRELRDQTDLARTTLLDLASGIYPPVLEELGVVAALREQAHAAGTRAEINGGGVDRFPIETEAAVYFVCLEAMQNAQKYARASRVLVRIDRDDGHLAFEVSDDGVGFEPSAGSGSGLQNMRDRLAALGGKVEIRSTPGGGTIVRGSVPLVREVVA